MQRLRSPAVPRSTIGTMSDEQFRDLWLKCSRSHVKGGIASVKVMSDLREIEGRCALPRRPDGGRPRGQFRNISQTSGDLADVPSDDDGRPFAQANRVEGLATPGLS